MIDSIYLREITIEDTNLIVKWRNSQHVYKNLYNQSSITAETHMAWFKQIIEKKSAVQYIICLKKNEIPIGTVFIKNIDLLNRKGEFGIFIGEVSELGKGYGKKATELILIKAFSDLKLNKVYLTVFEDNKNAIKSYLSSGFKIDCTLRDDVLINNSFKNVVLMSIVKSEWEIHS